MSLIKNQFRVVIKKFRSNNGINYFKHILDSFFQKEWILHKFSCVYTPEQLLNWKMDIFQNKLEDCSFKIRLQKRFWGEFILTVTYLINKLPFTTLQLKISMKVLRSFYPYIKHSLNLPPRIFGCVSFVHIHKQQREKLDPMALKCIFLWYFVTQKGYKCFHPPSSKIFVSRDFTLNEQVSYFYHHHLQWEDLREGDEPVGDFIFHNLFFEKQKSNITKTEIVERERMSETEPIERKWVVNQNLPRVFANSLDTL